MDAAWVINEEGFSGNIVSGLADEAFLDGAVPGKNKHPWIVCAS